MEKGSYQYSYTSRSPAAKQFEQEGKKKEVNKTRDALMKSNASSTKTPGSPIVKAPKAPKPNPFGSAKPREEVLARKGIDFHDIDERIQKKATVAHFSREQEAHIQILQDDLTQAEDALREANEKELPEDSLRMDVERKRRAFNELLNRYKKDNEGKNIVEDNHRHEGSNSYERRSQTRRFGNHRDSLSLYKKSKVREDVLDPFASFHRRDKQEDRHHRSNF